MKTSQIEKRILTRYFPSDIFQLTYADIIFFDVFNNFLGKGKPGELSKFPKLEEHYKKVRDVSGIKAGSRNARKL